MHTIDPAAQAGPSIELPAAPRFRVNKEPWSWITHFAGFVAALGGAVFLWANTPDIGPKRGLMAFYMGSLLLVLASSSAYHFFDLGDAGNKALRKLDHSAIFLLIAGNWLAPAMHLLSGPARLVTLYGMLGLAGAGIVFKLLWVDAPRWLTATIYLAMAWGAFIPSFGMLEQHSTVALAWLFAGGACYCIGALIYATKWPDPLPDVFGFHEVWHLFVLAGATCHYFWVLGFCAAPCLPL